MTEEENVKIFDLVVKGGTLPATLDKLVPLSFIGSAAVSFYRAKVKLMDQLGMTEEQRKATLRDGQDAGKMLLDIEARIGELMANVRDSSKRTSTNYREVAGEKESAQRKRVQASQAIASNPAAVAAVIREAEENEDIPTKTAVLNKIRADKAETKLKEAQARAGRKNAEAVDETVEANKRFVAEYFESIKAFVDDIELAIVGAQRHKFDANAKNFVTTKHDKVRALMTKLEESI